MIFTVRDMPLQFLYEAAGEKAAEAVLTDGVLTVSVFYRGHEKPLRLTGSARGGDTVRLTVRPYRLELAIGQRLQDEEWPFDTCLLTPETREKTGNPISVLPAEDTPYPPSVVGRFTGAEEWRPDENEVVGECIPYAEPDRYHVLYLKDRHHHCSKWTKGAHQWEHISTKDLKVWDIHPMAIPIDDPMEGSICTGSWIAFRGVQYLYYTVRTVDGSPAPIRRSVSLDGYHFIKDKAFSFTLSETYKGVSARDPKVVLGEDGLLHMFLTTSLASTGKGCLAHLTSEDGEHFTEVGTIYEDPEWVEPECSDYFALNGRYYLIFSRRGQGQYRVSDKPFSDFKAPENPVIPCHSVPKCAIFKGRILFAGFKAIGGYAGNMTFTEAKQEKDGTLSFFPVRETEESKRG
ncbi:MAG: hypothetical protein MJ078_03310 [Clostridia bacterium]|nr:hypothetical protein [Clostridia bacterium]